MRRPQSVNNDGTPNYNSSHLIEYSPSDIPFDVGLLVGVGKANVYAIGTAFFIGEDYAVTAWHVIEHLIEELQPGGAQNFENRIRRNPNIEAAAGFKIVIHVKREKQEPTVCFGVEFSSKSPLSDIALLKLSPTRQEGAGSPRIPMLHAAPPPVGTAIDAFGIIANPSVLPFDGERAPLFSCEMWWSHGVLREHLWDGRGSILPFPIFETTANFPGGMSGGPVVSESGVAFGIVCYDLGPNIDDLDADPISYVCSLLPLACCKCEHDYQDGHGLVVTTVKELSDRGIIELKGLERVELVWEGNDVVGLNLPPE